MNTGKRLVSELFPRQLNQARQLVSDRRELFVLQMEYLTEGARMSTWMQTCVALALLTPTATIQAQKHKDLDSAADLAPELRPFEWMLEDWELERVWSAEAARDPLSMAAPIKGSLRVTITDSGALVLTYEYVVFKRDRLAAGFGAGTRIHFRHTDALEMQDGRLVVTGVAVRSEPNGDEDVSRYRIEASTDRMNRVFRQPEPDTMQHIALRTSIRARNIRSYADLSYRPFTPITPKPEDGDN